MNPSAGSVAASLAPRTLKPRAKALFLLCFWLYAAGMPALPQRIALFVVPLRVGPCLSNPTGE